MKKNKILDEYFENRHIDEKELKIILSHILNVKSNQIHNITISKKGLTNLSFIFEYDNKKYIMRMPGSGTEKLINRKEEAAVYKALKEKNICDNIIYNNADTGYKISEYYENSRVANPFDKNDIERCMEKLRDFHSLKLSVNHEFNLFDKINYYESLWVNNKSRRNDYEKVKHNIFSLKEIVDKLVQEKTLTHIDAVSDNFLFVKENDEERIILIDWEYSGMQDPDVDIAMFAIYSMYNKKQLDFLIDTYFKGNVHDYTRIKIYCYVAICGLLWSNWTEYKMNLGEELEEYAISQYKYATEYYEIVKNELEAIGGLNV